MHLVVNWQRLIKVHKGSKKRMQVFLIVSKNSFGSSLPSRIIPIYFRAYGLPTRSQILHIIAFFSCAKSFNLALHSILRRWFTSPQYLFCAIISSLQKETCFNRIWASWHLKENLNFQWATLTQPTSTKCCVGLSSNVAY